MSNVQDALPDELIFKWRLTTRPLMQVSKARAETIPATLRAYSEHSWVKRANWANCQTTTKPPVSRARAVI